MFQASKFQLLPLSPQSENNREVRHKRSPFSSNTARKLLKKKETLRQHAGGEKMYSISAPEGLGVF